MEGKLPSALSWPGKPSRVCSLSFKPTSEVDGVKKLDLAKHQIAWGHN